MADVLKTTNWWSSNPPAGTYFDVSGSGGGGENRLWTAAEVHDALDTTYEELRCLGDGISLDGSATIQQEQFITAATGGIKFLRIKARGRVVITGPSSPTGSGSFQVLIGGALVATQSLDSSYTSYQFDLTTDPATGLAWTAAGIAAKKFGLLLAANAENVSFSAIATLRMTEFTVEVWGQDILATATPAVSQGSAAAAPEAGGALVGDKGTRDPAAVVPQAATLDATSALVTLRSGTGTYNDQDLSTATTKNNGPGGSGTDLLNLGGVQGATAINGSGLISGIKLFATVRATRNGGTGTLTNFKFGTAMGAKTLLAQPTVYDNSGGLTLAMYQTLESNLITLGAFANPFLWGNGVDSVWANLVSPTWTLNYDWTGGVQVRVEIAEAWVEVHGPSGAQPILIELTHALNLAPKVQSLVGTF